MPNQFVLDGNRRAFQSPQYEPLTDRYLSFFFQRNKVFKQLKRCHVLNRKFEIIDPQIKLRLTKNHNMTLKEVSGKSLNIKKLVNSAASEREWLEKSKRREHTRAVSKRNFTKYLSRLRQTVGVRPGS